MTVAQLYPYIYVNADGTARELHASERQYLETEFRGGDGAAPYIKFEYQQRDGWGWLSGYMQRTLLPDGIPIHHAPIEDPLRPQSREERIAWYRARGVELTENADGSVTIHPGPRLRRQH